ncbi:unnamed protein product [Durusdinium trenchii]|uniref:Two pore calcium channel protein 1 (OsTPC1) (Voltage-dependent calcium channel protein TPC1) n=2 Tax=Durusdinium trenchii TaxID=1381693 RepID=A0ABP0Q8N8_9DINO
MEGSGTPRAPLLHADPRQEGIGQAAWQLEDCLKDRLFSSYPSNYKARQLHFEVARANLHYTRALAIMLILTVFETPPWCNLDNFFAWESGEERCQVEGVSSSHILLSNVSYIPPGWSLVIEGIILFVIARKLLLERMLQVRYFKPIAVEYHSLPVIRFGLVMCLWKLADMLVFGLFRPNFRTAFVARTGFLVMLPSVRRLGHCVFSVIGEFMSIAVIYVGTVIFFAWVFVTIFDDIEGIVHGKPVNHGLDSFSRSLNTIFIAGSTDDFVDCLLPTYTSYRSSGLLWFVFLVIVHVLLLNLVLDTLVAAYTKYSEEQEEEITSEKVQGILNVFRTVSRVTDSSVITRQTFMDFCEEFSRSPGVRSLAGETADIMFTTMDADGSNELEKDEFFGICGVIQYDFWAVVTDSPVKQVFPALWDSKGFSYFRQQVYNGNFDTFMNYVLLLNLLLVVSETAYDLNGWEEAKLMEHLELIFSFVYVTEVGLTLCVYSWAEYWSSRSNQFDFMTTWLLLGSSVGYELVNTSGSGLNVKKYMNILRLLRLLRVAKQLKRLKAVQFMIATITKLIMASQEILILLGVIVFFFSALGLQLWGGTLYKTHPALEGTEYEEKDFFVLNFNDFLMSFAVWVVLLLCEYKDEFSSAVAATSSVPGSWLVFLLFYILGVSIIFELVKAFTIEVFVELHKHRNKEVKEFQALKAVEAEVTSRGQTLHYRIVGDLTLHEKIIAALEEVEHEIHEELESGHHGENGHDGHANGGHANGGHANGHGHGG